MEAILNINPLLSYIIGVVLCSSIFYLAGRFMLNNCKFTLSRVSVLFGVLLSIVLPIIKIGIYDVSISTQPVVMSEVMAGVSQLKTLKEGSFWSAENVAIMVYCIIATILLARFLVSLLRLRYYSSGCVMEKINGISTVVGPNIKAPFSFGRKIYLPENLNDSDKVMILRHEQAHILLYHSVDKSIMEIACALFWFNPIFFLTKRSLCQIHEYEADNAVVLSGYNKDSYKQTIFNQITYGNPEIVSGLAFSLTKKRIIMLSKTKKLGWVRSLAILPASMLALALVSFTTKDVVSIPVNDTKLTASNVEQKSEPTDTTAVIASFDGELGTGAFTRWCQENIYWPLDAPRNIYARIIVGFVVEADGKLSNIHIVRSGGNDALDRAALNLVRRAPSRWTPAKNGTKPVRIMVNMPISFVGDQYTD